MPVHPNVARHSMLLLLLHRDISILARVQIDETLPNDPDRLQQVRLLDDKRTLQSHQHELTNARRAKFLRAGEARQAQQDREQRTKKASLTFPFPCVGRLRAHAALREQQTSRTATPSSRDVQAPRAARPSGGAALLVDDDRIEAEAAHGLDEGGLWARWWSVRGQERDEGKLEGMTHVKSLNGSAGDLPETGGAQRAAPAGR
ncbi:hypothetical protein MSAN_00586000 [Mycena sanguinolenta]|uniref:Uncharacterized protein n=1 Tax=Mycena sanguinolenta TaxID=230812 RepID=A0A8H6ZDN0_9AGAR|nr:hypothetical protein MSAN_00586000 [Mycena sanguinolenta]